MIVVAEIGVRVVIRIRKEVVVSLDSKVRVNSASMPSSLGLAKVRRDRVPESLDGFG